MKKIVALFLLIVSFSAAAEDPVYTGFFSSKAVSGYDPVAYFDLEKGADPVKGDSKYTLEYKGADWFFSSLENLEKFKQNPDKYAPQYGGYCAWAVSAKNDFAPGDPDYWEIVEGKLYLNYNQSVKNMWDQDQAGHIKRADVNWPELVK